MYQGILLNDDPNKVTKLSKDLKTSFTNDGIENAFKDGPPKKDPFWGWVQSETFVERVTSCDYKQKKAAFNEEVKKLLN